MDPTVGQKPSNHGQTGWTKTGRTVGYTPSPATPPVIFLGLKKNEGGDRCRGRSIIAANRENNGNSPGNDF